MHFCIRALLIPVVLGCLFLGYSGRSYGQSSSLIKAIDVQGTYRVSPETVKSYLLLKVGQEADADLIDRSLKEIYNSGLFKDASMELKGTTLVIHVQENPIINKLVFEGNSAVKDKVLRKEIQLRPRMVFTQNKVMDDVDRILAVYRAQGRHAAEVKPKIIPLKESGEEVQEKGKESTRVNLVFEIDEGASTDVKGINFVGNKAFSDSELRSVISTSESAWFRFLSNSDRYDANRIEYDSELLRHHYNSAGFVDFRILSTTTDVTPDQKAYFITFTVEEGPRYKVGSIEINSKLPDVRAESLRSKLEIKSCHLYDVSKIEKTVSALNVAMSDRGFAFVEVTPDLKKKDNNVVDLVFEIAEGPKVYVERIEIYGNFRTLDSVIRREMMVAEGDAFNATRLRESKQKLINLDFFSDVKMENKSGSAPDKTVIVVTVQEKKTSGIYFGGGYSFGDGLLGKVELKETNFLGRGQELAVSTTFAQRSKSVDFSFTEPKFLGRDLSAGIKFNHKYADFKEDSPVDIRGTGGSVFLGYELFSNFVHQVSYGLEKRDLLAHEYTRHARVGKNGKVLKNKKGHTRFHKVRTSRAVLEDKGTSLLSSVSSTFRWDERDNHRDPKKGFAFSYTTRLAGLGGSERYVANDVKAELHVPLFGQLVSTLKGEAGHIYGFGRNHHINFLDRYQVGQTQMRGMDIGGIGPRDKRTKDGLGGTSYAVGTFELSQPITFLPPELGMKLHAFSDVGTMYGSFEGYSKKAKDDLSKATKLRITAGAGISFETPMGRFRIDYAKPIRKHKLDETQTLVFGVATRFL